MPEFQTPEDFRKVVSAFQKSRIILTAYELGIFSALGDDKKTSEEVSGIIGTDHRATDRLMNALVVCELLAKKDGRFTNSSFAKKHLVKGKPGYLNGFGHSVNMWNTWSGLTKAVRKGHTVRTDIRNSEWTEVFIAAMDERASKQAFDVVAKLDLKKVDKVLDVGGGSGAYSIAFVQAKPGLLAVVFDLQHVLPSTKKYINSAGLSKFVTTLAGNYLHDDMGTGYDLVFISAVIHINSPEENLLLVKRCVQTLNPGGWLVIQDHVMDEQRISPSPGVFFALNMLVATEKGDTYTEKEITGWMEQAGLKTFRKIETLNNALITGRKP